MEAVASVGCVTGSVAGCVAGVTVGSVEGCVVGVTVASVVLWVSPAGDTDCVPSVCTPQAAMGSRIRSKTANSRTNSFVFIISSFLRFGSPGSR